jgi:transcription elongation factor SPT5
MMTCFRNDFFGGGGVGGTLAGMQYKAVSIKTLQTTDIVPTIEELKTFRRSSKRMSAEDGDPADADDEDESMMEMLKTIARQSKPRGAGGSTRATAGDHIPFAVADTVQVVSGDLRNLMGRVTQINAVDGTVKMSPLNEDLKEELVFRASALRKFFRAGDHVKCVAGRYDGETGTIVHVDASSENWLAVLICDNGGKEIKAFVRDLQASAEQSKGMDSLQGYELHDLVAIGTREVGVIVHVGREDFKVLGQDGRVRTLPPETLRGKKNRFSARATALDMKHQHLSQNDMVRVIGGPYQGRRGTIRHVHRAFLFLHSATELDNTGIFVARARNTVLGGQKAKFSLSGDNMSITSSHRVSGMSSPALSRDDLRGRGRGRGRGNGRGRGRRSDPLQGKPVRVKKGRYKAYKGTVVDANDIFIRVELTGKHKTVQMRRDNVVQLDADAGASSAGNHRRAAGSYMGSIGTAFGGFGSQTPRLLGSETPMHAGMTPLRPSTPDHRPTTPGVRDGAWDPSVTATPVHPSSMYTASVAPASVAAGSVYDAAATPATYEDGLTLAPSHLYSGTTEGVPRTISSSTQMGAMHASPAAMGSIGVGAANVSRPDNSTLPQNDRTSGNIPDPGTAALLTIPGSIVEINGQVHHVIFTTDGGNTSRVQNMQTGEEANVSSASMQRHVPERRDSVIVIQGDNRGKRGKLINIDNDDGIVKMDADRDIKIIEMANLTAYKPING